MEEVEKFMQKLEEKYPNKEISREEAAKRSVLRKEDVEEIEKMMRHRFIL